MSDSINKAYEVALTCAAQDGLSPEEIMSMADSIISVPLITAALQDFFVEAGSEVEGEAIDLEEVIGALPKILEKMDEFEITTIDDAYMEDAVSVMGKGIAINNLCAAMCLLFCGSDGDMSGVEIKSVQKVFEHLPNIDRDIFEPLVGKIAQGFDFGE